MASEFGFRPCKIEDFKGQPKVQKMLQIYIKAAQIKKESYLLSKCYIQKQPRGRVITNLGRSMMGECE